MLWDSWSELCEKLSDQWRRVADLALGWPWFETDTYEWNISSLSLYIYIFLSEHVETKQLSHWICQ